jgi:hypothetical protein
LSPTSYTLDSDVVSRTGLKVAGLKTYLGESSLLIF